MGEEAGVGRLVSWCLPQRLLSPTPSLLFPSYGRVYAAADPYHHTIGPTATYSIGTMVRRAARNEEAIHPVMGGVRLQGEPETSSQCLVLETWEKLLRGRDQPSTMTTRLGSIMTTVLARLLHSQYQESKGSQAFPLCRGSKGLAVWADVTHSSR